MTCCERCGVLPSSLTGCCHGAVEPPLVLAAAGARRYILIIRFFSSFFFKPSSVSPRLQLVTWLLVLVSQQATPPQFLRAEASRACTGRNCVSSASQRSPQVAGFKKYGHFSVQDGSRSLHRSRTQPVNLTHRLSHAAVFSWDFSVTRGRVFPDKMLVCFNRRELGIQPVALETHTGKKK